MAPTQIGCNAIDIDCLTQKLAVANATLDEPAAIPFPHPADAMRHNKP